jgi:hypothetical protein
VLGLREFFAGTDVFNRFRRWKPFWASVFGFTAQGFFVVLGKAMLASAFRVVHVAKSLAEMSANKNCTEEKASVCAAHNWQWWQ